MTQTLAQQLARFAAGTDHAALPRDVRDSVVDRIIDVAGLCLGARPLPTSAAAVSWVLDKGGAPQAHVFGEATAVPATGAAFANGVLAHSLDYDDTHLPSILHPSACVVPAALAAGEAVGASGAQVVAAVAAGLEVTVRVGMAGYDRATNNSVFFDRGQHATSICGTIGAAVAAARLLGLGEQGVCDAIGVAASMGAGVIEANRSGGTVKRMHCGWAAQAGVSAAELVQRGITGPPTVLEGRFGFYQAFLSGQFDAGAVVDGLGTQWAVPGIFFKPYPANHFTHTAVDAAAVLRAEGVRPSDVVWARLAVADATVRTIGEPPEVKRAPETGYQAQFSGPYAVTVGLFGGSGLGASHEDYTDELARDPDRRALMAKVTVTSDPACEAVYPYQFPAVLTVGLTDGTTRTASVLANKGGDQRPLSPAELRTKFTGNATRWVSPGAAAQLWDQLSGIESVTDVRTLLRS